MSELLTDDQITEALRTLPGWEARPGAIVRSVRAPDFRTAIRLVDEVAEVAEQLHHHPDIDIRWTTVSFSSTTHSQGGVTNNDLELARQINLVVAQVVG
ncbi:4a-hydroxytetrahydrobiopterin dehydratase [Thermasporomyces composti]|jgi:4a-hydroxytetrahydrobiopterin dehydratase|uniref:Putative pterin-4-alpha-carbinolamine dehydratase n=1 Tax=Thermasporomyces composti TaxID=696763 RepID=A0A3D9VBQ1_THECX|nr:4a-hydroxytetrahydrobiopterin dehydratase [Thermasporomyces composti]REF35594.1 pterin-4-alpha-carbinolamine dehydratase [Thermasporomyces composti]